MSQIFLIGYMGAGKTTLGKCLAKRLGLSFVDMDLFIENRFRKSVGQIFKENGETRFREIERTVLEEIVGFENTIVSTGGGLPCFFDNIDLMNRHGTTIYLKVPINELADRLKTGKNNRPLIKNKSGAELQEFIKENIDKRETYYNKANLIISAENLFTRKDIDARVDDLIFHLEKQGII